MSEFSHSYHLRSDNSNDAVELLRRAKRKGFVFPSKNGWVTFVADGKTYAAHEAVIAAAPPDMPLLWYLYAEDFGWHYFLMRDSGVYSFCSCSWHPEFEFEADDHVRDTLLYFIPSANVEALNEFEKYLRPKDFSEIEGVEPSKLFARAIGLEHFEWIWFDHVAEHIDEDPEQYEGVIKVAKARNKTPKPRHTADGTGS